MASYDLSQINDVLLPKLQYFFNDEKIAKFVLVLSYFFLVSIVYLNAALIWNYLNWKTLEPVSSEQSNIKSTEVSTITQKHLFGVTSKPGATLANAKETKLAIKLKGVVVAQNPKLGSAMLSIDNAEEESYHVGDDIMVSGIKVTLEYIFREKVYINNDGSLEYVLYPKLEGKIGQPGESGSPLFDKSIIGNSYLPKADAPLEEDTTEDLGANIPMNSQERRQMIKSKVNKQKTIDKIRKKYQR